MQDLTPLIPGIYTDGEGRVFLNMREFLTFHGIPDRAEVRSAVWQEIRAMFGDVPILEITD